MLTLLVLSCRGSFPVSITKNHPGFLPPQDGPSVSSVEVKMPWKIDLAYVTNIFTFWHAQVNFFIFKNHEKSVTETGQFMLENLKFPMFYKL